MASSSGLSSHEQQASMGDGHTWLSCAAPALLGVATLNSTSLISRSSRKWTELQEILTRDMGRGDCSSSQGVRVPLLSFLSGVS